MVAVDTAGAAASSLSVHSVVAVEHNKCLLPPNYVLYLAWGFADGSVRLGSVFDSGDKARCVFEMVDYAEILCCTAANKRTIVTAGISTVVRIWEVSYRWIALIASLVAVWGALVFDEKQTLLVHNYINYDRLALNQLVLSYLV